MEKNPTNTSITKRYLQAMQAVIAAGVGDVKTKKDFAEAVGITPQRLNGIEKRTDGYVTAEQAARICVKFGVSASWLMFGSGSIFATAQPADRLSALEARVTALEKRRKK